LSDENLAAVLSELTAGETLSESVTFADYLSSVSGSALVYRFRGPGAGQFEIAATAGTAGAWDLLYAAALTEKLEPGTYAYTAYHTLAGVTVAIDKGTLTILGNPGLATHAQKVLAGIRAVIEGRASNDQLTISLGDTQLQYMTAGELLDWETRYQSICRREVSGLSGERGGPQFGIIRTRFTR
jgi:hypothetical protein